MAKPPDPPRHPGAYLKLDVLPGLVAQGVPLGVLAERLGVSRPILLKLVDGEAGVTPSMALRLAAVLGGTPEHWMALQAAYDLAKARAAMGGQLAALKPLPKPRGGRQT